jgi:PhnB protein
MARVSTYLNFPRNTEKVFNFYKSVFGGEFSGGCTDKFGVQWMFNCTAK